MSDRAGELDDLLQAILPLIFPYIRATDEDITSNTHLYSSDEAFISSDDSIFLNPEKLQNLINFELPDRGKGKTGLISVVESALKYSANTWNRGFMDKLYASTNPVGVISELLLAVLNTNVHVYKVSPALSIIEKSTARAFARLFGFDGEFAGGISTQGGSASNLTSIIVARNNLHPISKRSGNLDNRFVIFTSAQGHYSIDKAAQTCGIGTDGVCSVPIDEHGCMIPSKLENLIEISLLEQKTPFYVNATAGTTVLGSYDPFTAISAICKKFNLWLHIDASWGGPVIFSKTHRKKLAGSHLADSLAVNPHKMMGVPVTCSFLLTPDLRKFYTANSQPANYLFHTDSKDEEIWDLADMTLQCGRRGDSLKLALAWIYYGSSGFEQQIDGAFIIATKLTEMISINSSFFLVSENPPPCLQVCFYFIGKLEFKQDKNFNDRMTIHIVNTLIPKGFFVDYASSENGAFLRVVINRETRMETIIKLIDLIQNAGRELMMDF